MRALLAFVILALAFVQAAIDWQATIGAGYAYRLSSIGGALRARWPEGYAQLVDSLQRTGIPYAWDPLGALALSVPLAPLLAVIAAVLWLSRPREASRRR